MTSVTAKHGWARTLLYCVIAGIMPSYDHSKQQQIVNRRTRHLRRALYCPTHTMMTCGPGYGGLGYCSADSDRPSSMHSSSRFNLRIGGSVLATGCHAVVPDVIHAGKWYLIIHILSTFTYAFAKQHTTRRRSPYHSALEEIHYNTPYVGPHPVTARTSRQPGSGLHRVV